MKRLSKEQLDLISDICKMRHELMAEFTSAYIARNILGVCPHTLSNICNERSVPSANKLRLYATVLAICTGGVVKNQRNSKKKQ